MRPNQRLFILQALGCSLFNVPVWLREGQPVLEDVAILLDAMKLRGEKIDDTDLDAACNAGSFLLLAIKRAHLNHSTSPSHSN